MLQTPLYLSVCLVQVLLAGGGAVVLFIRAVDLLLLLGVDVLDEAAAVCPKMEKKRTFNRQTEIYLAFTNRECLNLWKGSRAGLQRTVWDQKNPSWLNKDSGSLVQVGDLDGFNTYLLIEVWVKKSFRGLVERKIFMITLRQHVGKSSRRQLGRVWKSLQLSDGYQHEKMCLHK